MSYVVDVLFYIMYGFYILIGLNIILTWIPFVYEYKFFRFLRRITDTYMEPFHGKLVIGMFDFSPIVGIILFRLILQAYVGLL